MLQRYNNKQDYFCEPNNAMKELLLTTTPHIRQRYLWDCGIACILMVISEKDRNYFSSNFSTVCRREGIHEITWTIDLCYFLKRFKVKHCMYTKKIGISCKHKGKISIIEADLHRGRKRLNEASCYGLQILERTLSTKDLIHHVESLGPAIVLVDARLLTCDWCKRNKLTSELRSIWGGTYQGHYITVVGCSDKILYRDPACRHDICATTPRRLDAARSTPGTDHDVILINK